MQQTKDTLHKYTQKRYKYSKQSKKGKNKYKEIKAL